MTVSIPEEKQGYDFDAALRRRLGSIQSYAQDTHEKVMTGVLARQQAMQNAQNSVSAFSYDTPNTSNSVRDKIVQSAAQLKGTPYVWGGESFQEGGFDCSGLVQYVYKKMGMNIPRVAAAQASSTGKVTAIQNLKPGDLVGWGSSPATASHIAIYAGNGMVWQAPRKGDVVKLSPIQGKNAFGISVSMLG